MGDFSEMGPTWRGWPSMNQEAVSGARFERQKLYALSSWFVIPTDSENPQIVYTF